MLIHNRVVTYTVVHCDTADTLAYLTANTDGLLEEEAEAIATSLGTKC